MLESGKGPNSRVSYFGTKEPMEVERLFSLGVEFPLVNWLGEAMEVAEGFGIERWVPEFGVGKFEK